MFKTIAKTAAVAVIVFSTAAPAFAGYYEWSTRYPFSGWTGGYGKGGQYCDYIRYPKRHCSYKRVCHHGQCYEKRRCHVVGWHIRQSCS